MDERLAFCLDIGGTRLKWCLLTHQSGHVQDWTAIQVRTMRSAGWLNASLPDLFRPDSPASIAAREPDILHARDLCVAVNSPVLGHHRIIGGRLAGWHVPPSLYSILATEYPGRRIHVLNDAEAAFHGFIRYTIRYNLAASAPFILLALGTSVGIVVARTEYDIVLSEFDDRISNRGLRIYPGRPWEVHRLLGSHFFATTAAEHRDWSYYDICEVFTAKVIALVRDCFDAYLRPRTVVIGGGNAEYVLPDYVADACGVQVYRLTQPELTFNPDLVPLIGTLEA